MLTAQQTGQSVTVGNLLNDPPTPLYSYLCLRTQRGFVSLDPDVTHGADFQGSSARHKAMAKLDSTTFNITPDQAP